MSTLPTPAPRKTGASAWMGQSWAGLQAIDRDLSMMTRVGGGGGSGLGQSGEPRPLGPHPGLCSLTYAMGRLLGVFLRTPGPWPQYEMRRGSTWLQESFLSSKSMCR